MGRGKGPTQISDSPVGGMTTPHRRMLGRTLGVGQSVAGAFDASGGGGGTIKEHGSCYPCTHGILVSAWSQSR